MLGAPGCGGLVGSPFRQAGAPARPVPVAMSRFHEFSGRVAKPALAVAACWVAASQLPLGQLAGSDAAASPSGRPQVCRAASLHRHQIPAGAVPYTALCSPGLRTASRRAQITPRPEAPAAQARTWVTRAVKTHGAAAGAALSAAAATSVPSWVPALPPHWGVVGARDALAASSAAQLAPANALPPSAPIDALDRAAQQQPCTREGVGGLGGAAAEAAPQAAAASPPAAGETADGAGCAGATDASTPHGTAGAGEEAAKRRQRSRDSAAAMQPLPLPEGMGDAATAAAAFRPEMAEMRALLAAHDVALPASRFDNTDAELFRFAATMGLLKARTREERCARLRFWEPAASLGQTMLHNKASCPVRLWFQKE
jgi:hypothetical protein